MNFKLFTEGIRPRGGGGLLLFKMGPMPSDLHSVLSSYFLTNLLPTPPECPVPTHPQIKLLIPVSPPHGSFSNPLTQGSTG